MRHCSWTGYYLRVHQIDWRALQGIFRPLVWGWTGLVQTLRWCWARSYCCYSDDWDCWRICRRSSGRGRSSTRCHGSTKRRWTRMERRGLKLVVDSINRWTDYSTRNSIRQYKKNQRIRGWANIWSPVWIRAEGRDILWDDINCTRKWPVPLLRLDLNSWNSFQLFTHHHPPTRSVHKWGILLTYPPTSRHCTPPPGAADDPPLAALFESPKRFTTSCAPVFWPCVTVGVKMLWWGRVTHL